MKKLLIQIKKRVVRNLQKKTFHYYKIRPEQPLLISYPRSGNTWMRYLMANYLYDNDFDLISLNRILPDAQLKSDESRKGENVVFVKSHHPYEERIFKDNRFNPVVYLVRDPRSVAVSLYHYLKKTKHVGSEKGMDTFVQEFCSSDYLYSGWANHVKSWLSRPSNSEHNFLVLKYEDLRYNTEAKFSEVLAFLGYEINSEQMKRAIERTSIQQLRKNENDYFDVVVQNHDPSFPFFRKGETDEWKTFFNQEQLNVFRKYMGHTMSQFGYN